MPDPYCYEGTSILINCLDLRDQIALDLFESRTVSINLLDLIHNPLSGGFNIKRLCKTHGRIFYCIYPWAGQLRQGTGILMKRRLGRVVSYAHSDHIETALAKVMGELSRTRLDWTTAAEQLAYLYSELDAIHPFREGNSRTLRKFMGDFAQSQGVSFDWKQLADDEGGPDSLYRARDHAVLSADTGPLATLFRSCLIRTDSTP